MHRLTRLSLIAVLAFPAIALGDTFTDDFEGGTNQAGWSFIQGFDVIEVNGGNPGAWLHQPLYDTFGPSLVSDWGNGTPFEGDYRDLGVNMISFDLQVLDTDFPIGDGFLMSLLLRNTHGTPFDFDDDDYAYFVGPPVGPVGGGWVHYDVSVPSQSNLPVPPGWTGGYSGDCENFRPGVDWNDVITNVDRVEVLFLQPCFFAIFQQWNVGADNITITYEKPTSVESTSWGQVKALYR
jgi:hypothetical protein